MLEISEAGSAWPSTAAPDRGLGRSVAGRGRARIRGCKTQPSLIWIKAVSIEDCNYETVTTRMQPSVIVWDLETLPQRRDLTKVFLIFRSPELFAVATIHIAQGPSNEGVCSLLAQFRLERLHQRNQDLSLDFGLLNEGNAHAQPLVLGTVITIARPGRAR